MEQLQSKYQRSRTQASGPDGECRQSKGLHLSNSRPPELWAIAARFCLPNIALDVGACLTNVLQKDADTEMMNAIELAEKSRKMAEHTQATHLKIQEQVKAAAPLGPFSQCLLPQGGSSA